MLPTRFYFLILFMMLFTSGGFVARAVDIDPQRPAESLYRIYADAEQTGWTSLHHIQAGNMAYQMHDKARAVAHWQSSMTQDVIILQRLTQTLLDFNDWENAIDTMRQWLTIAPYEDFPNHQLGILLAARDPLQALNHLQATSPQIRDNERTQTLIGQLEKSPNDPLLPIRIGQTLFDQARFDYAEYAFMYGAMRNIQAAPVANAYLALTRQVQGKRSAEWMDAALKHGVNDPDIHHLNGIYLRDAGMYAESRDAFAWAVTLDLDNPRHYAELAKAYQLIGNLETARYWLEYAVLLSENDPLYVERLNEFEREEQTLINQLIGQ